MQRYDAHGRARDARHRVARDFAEMRAGRTTPNGGVYISDGAISGPDNVRRQFKGMVERCADCGFDLAGGPGRGRADRALHDGRRRVRAGLHDRAAAACSSPARIRAACTARTASAATASPIRRCSAASPATRWRRGSRATARCASPMPRRSTRASRAPRRRSRQARRRRRSTRSAKRSTKSCGTMSASCATRRGCSAPHAKLDELDASSTRPASPAGDRAFNLTWHDWLNLKNLILVSRVDRRARRWRARIRAARISATIFPTRATSRRSTYTRVRQRDGALASRAVPVAVHARAAGRVAARRLAAPSRRPDAA